MGKNYANNYPEKLIPLDSVRVFLYDIRASFQAGMGLQNP
jgi:hypothetical protein